MVRRFGCVGLLWIVAGATLLSPHESLGCGPFFVAAVFSGGEIPANGEDFAKGEIGILDPRLYRRYLLLAFRIMHGIPVSAREGRELFPAYATWQAELARTDRAMKEWLAVRGQFPGKTTRFSRAKLIGPYQWQENCYDDAFDTA